MKEVKQVFTVILSFSIKADQSTQITLLRKLTDFQNVIVIKKKLMLLLYKSAVYYINMKNQNVLYRLFYNLSFYKLRILHEYLNNTLIKDWIQYNISSVKFSVLFIFKRNESFWLCVDYQSLNKKTIKNHHFLSLIDKILNCLVKFYYFTKLNLKNTYHWI